MKLKVTISKTSNGASDYIQIMSDDYTTVNVTSVADEIEVIDARPTKDVLPSVQAARARRGRVDRY